MALEKNTNNNIRYCVTVFFLSVFFFVCNTAHAATLQINANSATLASGGIVILSIVLNSEGVPINNVEGKIIFPADLLEVVSVNKSNSVFSLWVEEPAYSNVTGTISFNGGIPTPGFNGANGTAISIVVKAKKVGQADILFSDVAVRANDGFGTDVLRVKTGKTLSIIQKEEPVRVEVEVPKLVPSTIALQVTSPTHPSQELWYRNDSPTFSWKIPAGVDAIQTGIDNHKDGSPRVTFSPAIRERTVKDWKNGIWYFKVRARKYGEWGPISTYVVRIDTTIPTNNEVVFSYDDDKKVLNIKADVVDETSGVDYYEIYINDVLIEKVASAMFVNNTYELAYEYSGDSVVKLLAVDRAGNSIESLGSFKSTATPEPMPEPVSVITPEPVTSTPELVPTTSEKSPITTRLFSVSALCFIIAIIFVMLILVLGAFRLGYSYSNLQNKLKVHTTLLKGDNIKVLFLLRKRLEKHLEILQRTRHLRMLSKEEKEIKEDIEGHLDEVDKMIEEQNVG